MPIPALDRLQQTPEVSFASCGIVLACILSLFIRSPTPWGEGQGGLGLQPVMDAQNQRLWRQHWQHQQQRGEKRKLHSLCLVSLITKAVCMRRAIRRKWSLQLAHVSFPIFCCITLRVPLWCGKECWHRWSYSYWLYHHLTDLAVRSTWRKKRRKTGVSIAMFLWDST